MDLVEDMIRASLLAGWLRIVAEKKAQKNVHACSDSLVPVVPKCLLANADFLKEAATKSRPLEPTFPSAACF